MGWGFGLVLGLTLLLAITGWYALNTLTERGEKVEKIALVSDYTKDLRIQRLRMGNNLQAEGLSPLQQILDKLAAHLENIEHHFEAPADLDLIRDGLLAHLIQ